MKPVGMVQPFILFVLSFQFAACQETNVSLPGYGGHNKPRYIWTTEWSADGKYIALGGDDSTLWVYSGNDFKLYKSYKANSMVKGVQWHPYENVLAVATMKGVQLLDVQHDNLTTIETIKTGGRGIGWNYNGELLGLADGRGVVQIFDRKGTIIRSIPKHNNNSYLSIDWHPFKNIIATGSDEIILFDTAGKQLSMFRVREQYTGILTVKWHPSGEFLASGDYGHENEGKPTLLQFWKEDGTKIKEMMGHHQEIRNLRWSHDGKYVATAADALRIWNKEGKLLWEGKVEENLWGVAWSKDDRFLVTGTFGNGKVKLWDNHAKLIKELNQ